ncbi:hypothetical protein GXP67_23030 [Rhodocytophaga rosea]|uniref:Uncharacterized protein n=1 Tax=Rhodocytophaga rosea TaxID=2704465 RepID=A0A6C0GMQ4_9BACT|nr:hypothetical protein [Rhodocytophaga rosea]QHT69305.1 hypothetical protein GXP67_23030 [Rhodocytophaga rosea]
MMNKYALVDAAFIVGTAVILLALNQFGKMDIVKTYAVPVMYGCYLIGRFSVKLVKKSASKQESKLESITER